MQKKISPSRFFQTLVLLLGVASAGAFAASATFVNDSETRSYFVIVDLGTMPYELKFAGYLDPNEATGKLTFVEDFATVDGHANYTRFGGPSNNVTIISEDNTVRME